MSSNETAAYEIMKSLDVDYVLIIFGGVIGYSGDDINKFLWMVRIAEGEHPRDIRVSPAYWEWDSCRNIDGSGGNVGCALGGRTQRIGSPEWKLFPWNMNLNRGSKGSGSHLFLCFHRKVITSPPRENSEWIKPVPPRCSTA